MRISEIELDNFKSFGEKTTIPFLSGFTTVSGPNGSGKSNVVDSLMFALGLTTTRNMRAEKLTDLINNISGKDYCAVKVIFKDDESGEEIKVQRRIRLKKEGYDSKYFIDDESTTLREIHDRLGKFNISPKGYNVVMQGDVASIISMNPVDRRKIIDEIAGVAEFDRKIELADRELTVVQERIEDQKVILEELEKRLNELKSQRDKAIKYAELKERRHELERQFLAVRIKQVKTQKEATEKLLEELQQKKIDLQVERNTIHEQMAEAQNNLNKLNEEIEALGEGRQRELGEKRENIKTLIAREESGLEYINKQIEDHLALQKKLDLESKKIKKSLKDTEFKAKEFAAEIENIKANIAEEEEKYNALQTKILEKSKNSNLSTQSVMESQDKIAELKKQLADQEQEKARLEEKLKLFEEELANNREQAETALQEIQKTKSQMIGGVGDELKSEISFLSRNIQALKDEQRDTKSEIAKQEQKLKKTSAELSKIEGQEQAANAAGYGRAVDLVLNQEGVHGTLAQLGTVDKEYSLAVETAAGARLRAVVADDDYVAQECIDFLRSKNAGRATFLPLNKLQQAREYPLPRESGVVDWAINLVSFDEDYRDAFSYAFANTLVVKNLEVSRKLIGRYRMVTLQGDVVERSGAMTGGAAVKSNIHFGADVERLGLKLEEEKKQLEGFVSQLTGELNDIEKQIDDSQTKLEKLREEYSEKQSKSGFSEAQLKNLEESYEKNKSQISIVAEKISNHSEEKEKIERKIKTIQDKIDGEEASLEKLAGEMSESGLESLIQESRDIEIEIKRYQTMLNNVINDTKSLEVEKNFNSQSIDKLNTQISESKAEVDKLESQKPEFEAKIQGFNQQLEQIIAEIEEIKAKLAGKQEEKNQLSQSLINFGQRKGEVNSNLESTALRIVESKKKLVEVNDHLEKLLEELKEHPELEDIDLPEEDVDKLQAELSKIERQMRQMEPINMNAVHEYEEVNTRRNEIISKQESLSAERAMLIEKIGSYKNDKIKTFLEHFTKIDEYFREIFADLSFGNGELILEDPETVFEGGLVIKAQPRGKKMQRLEAMSGGEKSLTALSFLFALQQCNPAPFYAFDEVDSALDGINVDRLASKINRNAQNTQFIVVSHRRPMLEQSDRAVGVSINKRGYSRVLGVKNVKEENHEQQGEELVAA